MGKVMIYRKQNVTVPKMTAKQIKEALADINEQAKVNRDDVVRFFLDGSFNKLPVTTSSVIYQGWQRRKLAPTASYVVPDVALGRKGEANETQAISLRLWIKKYLASRGVNTDAVSVIYEGKE